MNKWSGAMAVEAAATATPPPLLLSLSTLCIVSTPSFGEREVCWHCGSSRNIEDVLVEHTSFFIEEMICAI